MVTNQKIEKKFKFDLELGIGKYKIKNTKKHKIAYFVLDRDEPYTMLLEFKEFLNRAGYKKVGYSDRYSNAVKIYLKTGNYRVVNTAPYFCSLITPRNRIPDFIRELVR